MCRGEAHLTWQPELLKAKSNESKSQQQQHLAVPSDLVKELGLQLRKLLTVCRVPLIHYAFTTNYARTLMQI